ncbi:MAG: hypothetical protein AAGG47_07115 [Pseudomonadota bacterium]
MTSHLGPDAPSFTLDLTADRLVLTADTAREYPSESLLALDDVSGGVPPLRGAEIVANTLEGFGAGDIDVSADRLAFDFGGIQVDAGDRIEIRVDFAISREEPQTLALLYEAALDQDGDVDAPGLNFWIDRREDGLSLRDIADRFLTAVEFTARFGPIESLSAEQYVDWRYQNGFGRARARRRVLPSGRGSQAGSMPTARRCSRALLRATRTAPPIRSWRRSCLASGISSDLPARPLGRGHSA